VYCSILHNRHGTIFLATVLNQIVEVIQTATESKHSLISPITGVVVAVIFGCNRLLSKNKIRAVLQFSIPNYAIPRYTNPATLGRKFPKVAVLAVNDAT